MTKRVLITGITGFLGSRLALALKGDWTVFGTCREDSKKGATADTLRQRGITILRLRNEPAAIMGVVEEARPDIVIHTASASYGAETADTIREMVFTNIERPSLMLQAMKSAGVRSLINCGSSWQSIDGVSYSPFNFYAATKQAFEDVIDHYAASGLNALTFRLFDTYGPGDTRSKILNLLIRTIRDDQVLDMTPGQQSIDLVHIEDVCEAIRQGMDYLHGDPSAGFHQKYSLRSDRPIPLRELAQLVSNVLGREVRINWGGRPYRDREIMVPRSPYPTLPGWVAKRTLEDGLAEICRSS